MASKADEVLTSRLKVQNKRQIAFPVEWRGRRVLGVIIPERSTDDLLTVRVIDASLPPSEMPTMQVPRSEVQLHVLRRHTNADSLLGALKANGMLQSAEVEGAMRSVPRSWFVEGAYDDWAVDIGCGVCISAPHMHSLTLELALPALRRATSVLDVGCGSGYLSAALAHLAPAAHVYGIDFHPQLARGAAAVVARRMPEAAGRITFVSGDGDQGYAPGAPYDAIVVGYMCEGVPAALSEQLKPGGRLVLPCYEPGKGKRSSYDARLFGGSMTVVEKGGDGKLRSTPLYPCSYLHSLAAEAKL